MGRKTVSLNGNNWEFGQTMKIGTADGVPEWLPASVPGDVREDLLRNGRIEDPFPAKQNELSKWVDDWNWCYRREFRAPAGAKRTFIRFDGIDYRSHIFVNGTKLAENVGMFAPFAVEVTGLLRDVNTLCVCIENSAQYVQREETMKCQMSFGWDFAPPIRTMGVWDSVDLIATGDAYISFLGVEPVRIEDDNWELKVSAVIDSAKEIAASAEFRLKPDNFDGAVEKHSFKVTVPAGVSEQTFKIPVKNPEMWNDWEDGRANLYNLDLSLVRNKKTIDNTSERFGFRTVNLRENDGRPGDIWTFEVNGWRKFVRGANWVPCDSLPGRVTKQRYRKLLEMARKANINMLRIWGGGLREKKAFYDLCDEMGILVWQEFPFACPRTHHYPKTKEFLGLVDKETKGILEILYNHPSVIHYCGGNEFSYLRNREMVDRIGRIVKKRGGGRAFKVSSPTSGEGHNWRIFHGIANIGDYREDDSALLSEFGMQAAPVRETLDKIIPAENQWPVAPRMPYAAIELTYVRSEQMHHLRKYVPRDTELANAEFWTYHDAHLYKLFRYAEQVGFNDVDSFIEATQKMQAFGLQTAIEHIRRRRFNASGVLFWQFNEPWPTVCWSVVDYYLKPKLAYDKIREIYSPQLFSLDFKLGPYRSGQTLRIKPYLINDYHREFGATKCVVRLTGAGGEELGRKEFPLDCVQPDSIKALDSFGFKLKGAGGWKIVCDIRRGGKSVGRNEYDLTISDKRPTNKTVTAINWLMNNLMWI